MNAAVLSLINANKLLDEFVERIVLPIRYPS